MFQRNDVIVGWNSFQNNEHAPIPPKSLPQFLGPSKTLDNSRIHVGKEPSG